MKIIECWDNVISYNLRLRPTAVFDNRAMETRSLSTGLSAVLGTIATPEP